MAEYEKKVRDVLSIMVVNSSVMAREIMISGIVLSLIEILRLTAKLNRDILPMK